MGVSVEGGKRGKALMVELNLVPFIDYMSCLIAFLMIAAVWTQVASLDVEQSVGEGSAEAGPPPLTVHLSADGTWVGRTLAAGVKLPKVGEAWDAAALAEHLRADRALFPTEGQIVINTDDGVPYEAMVQALDLSHAAGYPRPMLAGGPPGALAPG